MRVAHLFSFIICVGVAGIAAAGEIKVTCSPGFRVFMDGEFAGVTAEDQNGLLLSDVEAGIHTIRVEREGYPRQEFSVVAGPIRAEVKVVDDRSEDANDQRKSPAASEGDQPVGRIIVMSEPENCLIQFAGERVLKDKPTKTLRDIPAGKHKIYFERYGVVLSTKLEVLEGETTWVMVDFINNQVGIQEKDEAADDDPSKEQTAQSGCTEYWVEVMRVTDSEVIDEISGQLDELGFPPYHQRVLTIRDESEMPFYKIRIGPINDQKTARWAATKLKNAGYKGAWHLPAECEPRGPTRTERSGVFGGR